MLVARGAAGGNDPLAPEFTAPDADDLAVVVADGKLLFGFGIDDGARELAEDAGIEESFGLFADLAAETDIAQRQRSISLIIPVA